MDGMTDKQFEAARKDAIQNTIRKVLLMFEESRKNGETDDQFEEKLKALLKD